MTAAGAVHFLRTRLVGIEASPMKFICADRALCCIVPPFGRATQCLPFRLACRNPRQMSLADWRKKRPGPGVQPDLIGSLQVDLVAGSTDFQTRIFCFTSCNLEVERRPMVGLSTMILALRKRCSTRTCCQHIDTRVSMFLSQACCLRHSCSAPGASIHSLY